MMNQHYDFRFCEIEFGMMTNKNKTSSVEIRLIKRVHGPYKMCQLDIEEDKSCQSNGL